MNMKGRLEAQAIGMTVLGIIAVLAIIVMFLQRDNNISTEGAGIGLDLPETVIEQFLEKPSGIEGVVFRQVCSTQDGFCTQFPTYADPPEDAKYGRYSTLAASKESDGNHKVSVYVSRLDWDAFSVEGQLCYEYVSFGCRSGLDEMRSEVYSIDVWVSKDSSIPLSELSPDCGDSGIRRPPVRTEQTITLGGEQAMEVICTSVAYKTNYEYRYRHIVARHEGRVYELSLSIVPGFGPTFEKQFFDSFRFPE